MTWFRDEGCRVHFHWFYLVETIHKLARPAENCGLEILGHALHLSTSERATPRDDLSHAPIGTCFM